MQKYKYYKYNKPYVVRRGKQIGLATFNKDVAMLFIQLQNSFSKCVIVGQ